MKIKGSTGYKEMYITGSLGWGKSHLVCALVCSLMRLNKRVLYAPDARWLTCDSFQYLRDSFELAFADDAETLKDLDDCTTMQHLEKLAQNLAKRGVTMYIFVDQANALETESPGRSSGTIRTELSDSLNRLTFSHILIQSASGNYQRADAACLTQEQVDKVYMNGGCTEVNFQVLVTTYKISHKG